jgi:hypothetical protein
MQNNKWVRRQEGSLVPKSVYTHNERKLVCKVFFNSVSCRIHHCKIMGVTNQLSEHIMQNHLGYLGTISLVVLLCCILITVAPEWVPRDQAGHESLCKTWLIADNLNLKIQNKYTPEEYTIDEAICAFWSDIFFCVSVKWKLHKCRIEIFQLCEAKSGYVCD